VPTGSAHRLVFRAYGIRSGPGFVPDSGNPDRVVLAAVKSQYSVSESLRYLCDIVSALPRPATWVAECSELFGLVVTGSMGANEEAILHDLDGVTNESHPDDVQQHGGCRRGRECLRSSPILRVPGEKYTFPASSWIRSSLDFSERKDFAKETPRGSRYQSNYLHPSHARQTPSVSQHTI
jgi:hypothetical protein